MKKLNRWALRGFIGLAVLLLVVHLTLPYLVRNYLNEKLADMGDYSGHINDVDLAWWRGAYSINALRIVKDGGKVTVPLLAAPQIDIAVNWHSLWYDRAVVAQVIFDAPEINFVDGGSDPEGSQSGSGVDWREQLNKLLPITLNELRVVNGTLKFHNFTSTPPVNIEASKVNASLYNLTNVADSHGQRVAKFEGSALLLGQAPLKTSAEFDPYKNFEDFDFRLRAKGIELRQLNDFASAYGHFDFNAGHGDLVIQARAKDGQLNGYIKPLLRDVDVFNWQQDVVDQDKSLFRSIWEALVGSSETVLKNQRKNQFATRVELSGSVQQQDVSAFQAFMAILHNGFIKAFNARFERQPPGATDTE